MKIMKKAIGILGLTYVFLLCLSFSIHAEVYSHSDATGNLKILEPPKVIVKIMDTATGDVEIKETVPAVAKTSSSENQFSVTYETQIPLGSKERESSGGTQNNDYAQAQVTAYYTLSSDGEKIRVDKFSGSWTVSDSVYYISDRSCGVTSGALVYQMTKYPTTNSFSYNTGWEYVNRIGGEVGPHVWSDAEVWVSGMESSGSKNINILLAFGGY